MFKVGDKVKIRSKHFMESLDVGYVGYRDIRLLNLQGSFGRISKIEECNVVFVIVNKAELLRTNIIYLERVNPTCKLILHDGDGQ